MKDQPEARLLAECLGEHDYCTFKQMDEAAAELRRLHAEVETLKACLYQAQEAAKILAGRNVADEALLRQALEVLESLDGTEFPEQIKAIKLLRAALQKPEHITDGRPCWCEPELDYKGPETGAEVWVHRRAQ